MATQGWPYNYVVGGPIFKDFTIQPSTGYWIAATNVEVLNLQGTVPTGTPQSRTISVPGAGWAIVGFNSLRIDMRASDIVANYTGGMASLVLAYVGGIWKTYNPALPFTNYYLMPGQAYWIAISASTTGTLNYVA